MSRISRAGGSHKDLTPGQASHQDGRLSGSAQLPTPPIHPDPVLLSEHWFPSFLSDACSKQISVSLHYLTRPVPAPDCLGSPCPHSKIWESDWPTLASAVVPSEAGAHPWPVSWTRRVWMRRTNMGFLLLPCPHWS